MSEKVVSILKDAIGYFGFLEPHFPAAKGQKEQYVKMLEQYQPQNWRTNCIFYGVQYFMIKLVVC